MTSIEWLYDAIDNELIDFLEHRIDVNELSVAMLKAKQQAQQMHTKEVTICNHLEISDEEIEKAADKYIAEDEFNRLLKDFEEGAKWYREQLKQRQ